LPRGKGNIRHLLIRKNSKKGGDDEETAVLGKSASVRNKKNHRLLPLYFAAPNSLRKGNVSRFARQCDGKKEIPVWITKKKKGKEGGIGRKKGR